LRKLIVLGFPFFILARSTRSSAKVRAVLESCPGCLLDGFPELQAFIDRGEAEHYHKVAISPFHRGQEPTLTIFDDDGFELEKIVLISLSNEYLDVHFLLRERGFQRKSDADIEALQAKRAEKRREAYRRAIEAIRDMPLRYRRTHEERSATLKIARKQESSGEFEDSVDMDDSKKSSGSNTAESAFGIGRPLAEEIDQETLQEEL